jgi:hypothetical protein
MPWPTGAIDEMLNDTRTGLEDFATGRTGYGNHGPGSQPGAPHHRDRLRRAQQRRLTGRHFHRYINPERDIDAGAIEVHGITNTFLADKPRFAA